MAENIEKFKSDLKNLKELGIKMMVGFLADGKREGKNKKEVFESNYQAWYTEALLVIEQIIPNRLDEFKELYQISKRKNIGMATYGIQDWILGIRADTDWEGNKTFPDFNAVGMRFRGQVEILKSAERKFESSLFDIKQLVQADLFDSEIEAAKELSKNGFLRGAGAMAGVVLEKHLSQVCDNHSLKIKKKNPHINDFNEFLKENNVIQIPEWRNIQRLADLRNLCDHDKRIEPKKEQVGELIDGVDKIIKTIF